jgi:hypothetical protein
MAQRESLENADTLMEKSVETSPEREEKLKDDSAASPDESEYITGFKLNIVIAACTMAGFLMLLDTSIVATVSRSLLSVCPQSPLTVSGDSQNHK